MASATGGVTGICCDKKKAATTLASVGAAAVGAPCGSRMRDGLLWRPKGLLSKPGALPGKLTGERQPSERLTLRGA
jgi:hypothetical protein